MALSRFLTRLSLLATLALLSACLSPIALDRAALAYNQATADVLSKQLLLNIARAHHNEPIHFSGISNIAATFTFQMNAGATPALTGEAGSTILPLFGIAASESPTVSIVPMDGEEFTKRLLTPLQENKMTLLLRQNIDVDLLLRLVAQDYRNRENGRETVYHNSPTHPQSYAAFRRVVLHLSSIQDRLHLHAEPLLFEQQWRLPAAAMTAEGFKNLAQEYAISFDAAHQQYRLGKQISGRIIITNYDPALLSNDERIQLNNEAEQNSPNDLTIDIRPDYPGGEYPLHGKFRLRSFGNILNFIGRSMAREPEFDVSPDPRTQQVTENPTYALHILENSRYALNGELDLNYKDSRYSLAKDHGYPWNKTAFRLLAQIFQMTMAELPKSNAPLITISK
ncbi:MAG: hypothetical protein ACKN9T_05620 [Candidatus Methylumidiphilus sp.]